MAKYIKCSTSKSPIAYKCGERITFKLLPRENCQKVNYKLIKWVLRGDDGYSDSGVFKFNNYEPHFIDAVLTRPGFLRLTANVYSDEENIDRSFDTLEAGAGAEIEKLEYCDTIPEDFDEYWDDIKKMIDAHTPELIYEREMTDNVPEGFKAFDVRISVPCEGKPASGVLTYPIGAEKLPLRVIFQGYGVEPTYIPVYDKEALCLRLNAHGIENSYSLEESKIVYKHLEGYGFDPAENASNMTTYWRNMFIRHFSAIKYIKNHPLWDKKGFTPVGGSQGAFQATTIAAHDDDVTHLHVDIPWFCNLNAENCGFMAGWRPAFAEGLRYFDTVAQATRVKCPVNVYAKLGDYICPPSTTVTLYNAFNCIKAFDLTQSGTHPYYPPEPEIMRLRYDPASPSGDVKLGRYRHFEGAEYEVVGFGKDSESRMDTVIYRACDNGEILVCPKWMFVEYLPIRGIPTKRFEFIG